MTTAGIDGHLQNSSSQPPTAGTTPTGTMPQAEGRFAAAPNQVAATEATGHLSAETIRPSSASAAAASRGNPNRRTERRNGAAVAATRSGSHVTLDATPSRHSDPAATPPPPHVSTVDGVSRARRLGTKDSFVTAQSVSSHNIARVGKSLAPSSSMPNRNNSTTSAHTTFTRRLSRKSSEGSIGRSLAVHDANARDGADEKRRSVTGNGTNTCDDPNQRFSEMARELRLERASSQRNSPPEPSQGSQYACDHNNRKVDMKMDPTNASPTTGGDEPAETGLINPDCFDEHGDDNDGNNSTGSHRDSYIMPRLGSAHDTQFPARTSGAEEPFPPPHHRTNRHPDDISASGSTIIAMPAATPNTIRDAIQQQMKDAYQEIMAQATQQNVVQNAPVVPAPEVVYAEGVVIEDADAADMDDNKSDSDSERSRDNKNARKMALLGGVTLAVIVLAVAAWAIFLRDGSAESPSSEMPVNLRRTSSPMPSQEMPTFAPSSDLTELPTALPTNGPTEVSLEAALRKVLVPALTAPPSLIPAGDFDQPGTKAHKVLRWMVDSDSERTEALLSSGGPFKQQRLIDRFALAHLYVSTDASPAWTRRCSFMTNTDVCEWREEGKGVLCDEEKRVYGLNLSENSLRGEMPQVVFQLNAASIDLSKNLNLGGSISAHIASMERLDSLVLSGTEVAGTIPTEIALVSRLDLDSTKISGTIPPEIGNGTKLLYLSLKGTAMAGTIPTELGHLALLQHLNLGKSGISGTIPTEVGQLSSLQFLDLSGNAIVGSVPLEVENLAYLKSFVVSDTLLEGPIPSEMGELTDLQTLQCSDTKMDGTLPSELGNLSFLRQLHLERSRFSGMILPGFGNWLGLESLQLHGNSGLNGTIPSELGQLTKLTLMDLRGTSIRGSMPSELSNLSGLKQLRLEDTLISGNLDPVFCLGTVAFPDFEVISSDCSDGEVDSGRSSRAVCSCCTSCCMEGTDCTEQAEQPSWCDWQCVACDSNTYASRCGECPMISAEDDGGVGASTPLCRRSCAIDETSQLCATRVDFGSPIG